MKILLFGRYGQVGRELVRSLSPIGDLLPLSRKGDGGLVGDLTDLDGIRSTIGAVKPDVIVNAAAYTAVDKAESEENLADLINAKAPAEMAEIARECGALFINYSTDYVFDGSGVRPWGEDDCPGPLNVYGKTKLAAEECITNSGCRYMIFRTSWVYSHVGHNFIQRILNLAGRQDTLKVIEDQVGAPTGARLIADVTALTISEAYNNKKHEGIYHLVADGETSWWEYSKYVIARALERGMELKATPESVEPVSSDYFKLAARRPLNSRMSTCKIKETFNPTLSSWQAGVSSVVDSIAQRHKETQ